jgi:hypothetical protein
MLAMFQTNSVSLRIAGLPNHPLVATEVFSIDPSISGRGTKAPLTD